MRLIKNTEATSDDDKWNDYVDRYANYLRYYESEMPPSPPMTRTQYLAYISSDEQLDRFW